MTTPGPTSTLSALALFGVLAIVSTLGWVNGRAVAERSLAERTEALTRPYSTAIEGCVETRIEMVRTMAADLHGDPAGLSTAHESHAAALVDTIDGFLAVNLVDSDGVIVQVYPKEGNELALGRDLDDNPIAGPILARVRAERAVRMTPPVKLYQGGRGLATYAPLGTRGGRLLGFVNGVFRTDELFERCMGDGDLRDYILEVRDQGSDSPDPIVHRAAAPGVKAADITVAPHAAGVLDRTWSVQLLPTEAALRRAHPGLPSLLLGFSVSALLSALLGLLLRSRQAKRDAERLSRAEIHRLGSVVGTTGDFVALLGLDGEVQYLNRAARSLLGINDLGRPYHLDELPTTDPSAARAHVARTLDEGAAAADLVLVSVAGQAVPISFHTFLLRDPDSGEPIGLSTIGRDLRERHRLQQQLAQARQMEALGRLAGGVAHDFNNLLTIITAGVAELRAEEPPAPILERLDEIGEATGRAAGLTSQLLALGRRRPSAVGSVDLVAVLEDLRPLLRRLLRENIELDLPAGQGPLHIAADRVKLEQVVVNLATNGADAMPSGGTLHIEARPGLDVVRLVVEDTGHGMDAETRARVFEPFFTTKSVGAGSGLGLATVYGHTTALGGTIEIDSEPGRGTRFELTFPAASAASDVSPSATSDTAGPAELPPRPLDGRRLLLVEDDAAVRAAVRRLLERHGAEVREAGDGAVALDFLGSSEGDDIDLVLTDVVMPGLGGAAVLDWVGRHRPGLPVVLSSGYAESDVDAEAVAQVGARFVQKPYQPAELVRVLTDALGEGRRGPDPPP